MERQSSVRWAPMEKEATPGIFTKIQGDWMLNVSVELKRIVKVTDASRIVQVFREPSQHG